LLIFNSLWEDNWAHVCHLVGIVTKKRGQLATLLIGNANVCLGLFQDNRAFRLASAPLWPGFWTSRALKSMKSVSLDFRTQGHLGSGSYQIWTSRAMKSMKSVKAWISGHPGIEARKAMKSTHS
jgi:hypothetical protein